jgi:predicted DNA-binding transcriptional regulator AlpA
MKTFSTTLAARKLGIDPMTLSRYIKAKKVPAPKIFAVGGSSLHAWTEEEIENVRKLLPKIANGRKTRYKKQSALSNQQSAKTKRAQAGAPTLQKKKKKK